ncbi:MAG TPA: hypothetical protein VM266_13175 [Solirubrobacteraceae bacterium]|nr:hypothetical protein [Solirubrobacteraceae bacterium]
MSQISPPLRILLAGSVLFLAAWFVLLKPGASETVPAPSAPPAANAGGAPATTGPGKTVESAREAVNAVNARSAAKPGAAASAVKPGAATPAPAAAAKPEAVDPKLPKPVAKALEDGKVLVLMFWNPKAGDDRAVRRELREADSHRGRNVHFHVAHVNKVARYESITRGASVEQSPAIVVVDGKRQAQVLAGYSEHAAIEQAISDALRTGATGPTAAYLKKVDAVCARGETAVAALPRPTTVAGVSTFLTQAAAVGAASTSDFKAVKAPAKYRAFARDYAAASTAAVAMLKKAAVDAKAVKTPQQGQTLALGVVAKANALTGPLKRKYGRYNLQSCLG